MVIFFASSKKDDKKEKESKNTHTTTPLPATQSSTPTPSLKDGKNPAASGGNIITPSKDEEETPDQATSLQTPTQTPLSQPKDLFFLSQVETIVEEGEKKNEGSFSETSTSLDTGLFLASLSPPPSTTPPLADIETPNNETPKNSPPSTKNFFERYKYNVRLSFKVLDNRRFTTDPYLKAQLDDPLFDSSSLLFQIYLSKTLGVGSKKGFLEDVFEFCNHQLMEF